MKFFSPFTNSKNLNRSDSLTVSLKYGETLFINDELEIGFSDVPTDSRCPIDAMCVWAGDGEVKLNLKKDGSSKSISLHTTLEPKITLIDNYEIRLNQLLPSRRASEQIKPEQYIIEIKIKYLNSMQTKSLYMIDSNNEWLIRNDNIVVNNASLVNDLLTLSVSYSGGCKEHIINLFAYTGIMKSIPPQMSLVISHEDNRDMCEAYINGLINFNLKKIKEYLNGMGTTDRVILNIAGPDGQQIKQSPLVFNLK